MLNKIKNIILIMGAWLFASLSTLVLYQRLSYELFFELALLGYFIITGLSGPFQSNPKWKFRINMVSVLGFIILTIVIIYKVMKIANVGM